MEEKGDKTIEDKINRLRELGGFITIIDSDSGARHAVYNEIVLNASWSEGKVIEELNAKISFLGTRPWLLYIQDLDKVPRKLYLKE